MLLSGFHSLFSTAGRIAHRLREEDALIPPQPQGGTQRLAIDHDAHPIMAGQRANTLSI